MSGSPSLDGDFIKVPLLAPKEVGAGGRLNGLFFLFVLQLGAIV